MHIYIHNTHDIKDIHTYTHMYIYIHNTHAIHDIHAYIYDIHIIHSCMHTILTTTIIEAIIDILTTSSSYSLVDKFDATISSMINLYCR